MSCSYFTNKLAEYDTAYAEINNIDAATSSCIKAIFDSATAQIKSIISSGKCIPSGPVQPVVAVPSGEGQVWGINYAGSIFTTNDPSGSWATIPGVLRYIDRLPTANGGLVWGINPGGLVFRMNGTSGSWQMMPGSLGYLRISAFDRTVWGISSFQQVLWYKEGQTAWTLVPGSLNYLDISPKDGSVYGIDIYHKVYVIAGTSGNRTEISVPNLLAKHLRVISNGYVFALCTDGVIYYRPGAVGNWTVLDGQTNFVFFDINNNGRIFGIKSDNSVWSKEYISGTWTELGKKLFTLRVLDDGSLWGLGVSEYGSNDAIYYRNPANTAWQNVTGALVTLWGPTRYKLGYGLDLLS